VARNDWDDSDDYEGGDEFPQDESNLVKNLRKQLKEALKAKDELANEVQTLSKQTRTVTLKDVLTSKSLNPKLAAFYPSDGEVTPEAVDAWVKEYADVFGIQTQDEEAEPSVSAADVALHQRMAQTTDLPGNAQLAKHADLQARIAAAKTPEELQEILAGSGL
jgi:hypothetical protein